MRQLWEATLNRRWLSAKHESPRCQCRRALDRRQRFRTGVARGPAERLSRALPGYVRAARAELPGASARVHEAAGDGLGAAALVSESKRVGSALALGLVRIGGCE